VDHGHQRVGQGSHDGSSWLLMQGGGGGGGGQGQVVAG
jgi:hypothetical protein